MRFLIVLAALVLVAVVVVLLLSSSGSDESSGKPVPARDTRWEPHTESSGGVTAVLVRRVALDARGDAAAELDRQTVESIPDDDPEWEARYHDAMARARSRVAALDSQN